MVTSNGIPAATRLHAPVWLGVSSGCGLRAIVGIAVGIVVPVAVGSRGIVAVWNATNVCKKSCVTCATAV